MGKLISMNGYRGDLQAIPLSELPDHLEYVDMGGVRYPFFEVTKTLAPKFGRKDGSGTAKHTYEMKLTGDLRRFVVDQFVDNELRTIKNTPLDLQEAAEEFALLLTAVGKRPTHLVEVGVGIFAVVSTEELHVKVGTIDGEPAAALVNMFDKFPVFRPDMRGTRWLLSRMRAR
jgi:hypothetical protein